jgi:hypothetical protein
MAEISHSPLRNFSAPALFKCVEDLERASEPAEVIGSEAGGEYAVHEMFRAVGGADGDAACLFAGAS